ncbi:MAG TPA: pitrilysin family protein [Kofleriaceae bacterium]
MKISTTTLSNGQRVVLVSDPYAIDVQVTMRYQVGAVDDGKQPGMAHFVEHLMFQQVVDGQPLFTHFEDSATFFNAYTNYDATTYVSRAPANQLDKLLALEAARIAMRCESITDAAFAREREVVINELNERDQSTEVYSAIHSVLYPKNHPYRQAIGGSVQSVGAITREQACAFADAHYAPNNAVLVISGNLGTGAQAALDKLAAAAPKRATSPPHAVPAVTAHAVHVEVAAPIDDDILVLAWPLPTEPRLQAKVRAVAAALPKLVDAEIKGRVVSIEFGDGRAPMFGLAVLPADDETFQDAVNGTRTGIERLPSMFTDTDRTSEVVFDRIREGAVYSLYSSLEDGSDRDVRLATYVLAGLDPNAAFAADLDALRGLSREQGEAIARQYLSSTAPTVVTLKATAGKKTGQTVALRKPIHDMGQRRTPPDPTLARAPAERATSPLTAGAKTRTLPNGLKVVLLPMSSVPTVDIRLVFRAGTADEAPQQRGVAMLTANALTWDLRHLQDLMRFAAAGGLKNTDVGIDRTSFSVQGVDTHLDVLLAGLRRWILEGTFDDDSAQLVLSMRRATKRSDDEGVLTDTWRVALFGTDHPYVRAGIVRYANTALTLDDAAQFRATHYTPSNATLVIAGQFDPVLADRWIDFLFSEWKGPEAQRSASRSATKPASIARVDDLAMVQLRIALPATASSRAEQLVAAEMLSEIARDVRFQLGAGYTVDAQLSEQRLARHYVIGGWIDAARSSAAVGLIRDRMQRLRKDADAAARAFVTARKHVIAQLLSRVGSAEGMASRVEHDVEMERAPMSDLQTAAAVQALTIDGMASTIAELDLSRAAVLMRGPASDLESGFKTLGRTPVYVQTAPGELTVAPPSAAAPIGTTAAPVRMSDVQPALTDQPPPRIALAVIVNATAGGVSEAAATTSGTGNTLVVHAGYRYQRNRSIGVRTSLGRFDGTDDTTITPREVRVMPFDLGAAWFASGKIWWGAVSLGLHLDRVTGGTSHTYAGVGYSLEVGADFIHFGWSRIGIALALDAMSGRTSEYGSTTLSVGLVYRH